MFACRVIGQEVGDKYSEIKQARSTTREKWEENTVASCTMFGAGRGKYFRLWGPSGTEICYCRANIAIHARVSLAVFQEHCIVDAETHSSLAICIKNLLLFFFFLQL